MPSTTAQDAEIPANSTGSAVVCPTPDDGDVASELEALLTKSGVYQLPLRAKVSLTGPDRTRWLNGIITNNMRDLPVDHGVYAFLLSPQGRILGDLYAYNRGESLLVDTDRSQLQKVLELFDQYIVMDEVEFRDDSDKAASVGVAGPKSREILNCAGFEFKDLNALDIAEVTWQNLAITVARGDGPSLESYQLWSAPDNVAAILGALENAGSMLVGKTALNLVRIAQGIPQYGQDIRERDLPQETGQDRALHFTKGCYIGQEIVERIRSRGNVHRRFSGFKIEGPLLPPGAKITIGAKDVGEVTSSAVLPIRGSQFQVALGYIRREVSDTPIEIDHSKLIPAALPFVEVFKN